MKKESGKKMGRPKIIFTKEQWEMFDRLAYMQCTLEEIAFGLGVSPDTVERRCKTDRDMTFAEYYKKRAAGGRMSLRRSMWKSAVENGNIAMQIWLSKQHLEMKDTPVNIIKVGDNKNVIYDIEFGSTFEVPDNKHKTENIQSS